jgi:hypothetical protein
VLNCLGRGERADVVTVGKDLGAADPEHRDGRQSEPATGFDDEYPFGQI